MDSISIKDHPPWYARGTPVIKTRDGPAMALNDKLLFAICRGPSGEGRGRGGSRQFAVGSWQSEVEKRQLAVGGWQSGGRGGGQGQGRGGRWESEDRSRGEPMGKTRRWLTLKTTFFNTQNSVSSQWYALLGSDLDLSACVAPDNVKMEKMEDNVKLEMVEMVDADRSGDAVRSGKAVVVGFDLSACEAFRFVGTGSDNVKKLNDNVD